MVVSTPAHMHPKFAHMHPKSEPRFSSILVLHQDRKCIGVKPRCSSRSQTFLLFLTLFEKCLPIGELDSYSLEISEINVVL